MEKFSLTDDDVYAISIATSVARRLLKECKLAPLDVIGIGNALFALQRLPEITEGASCEFGINISGGDDEFRERRYIDFSISSSMFGISVGGSVYSKETGSDSISEPGWEVLVDGDRETGCDIYSLDDRIDELFNLGVECTVDDQSDIDYESCE